jgi:hypothetical protein
LHPNVVKILVNPLGLTAFLPYLFAKSSPAKFCNLK